MQLLHKARTVTAVRNPYFLFCPRHCYNPDVIRAYLGQEHAVADEGGAQ